MKLMIFAGLAALPLAAVQARGPVTPTTYVMKAGASDQYEMQSSKLVLQSSRNAQLRRFAQMMVRDHTQSTADVKAAARQARVRVGPPMLDAKGRSDVAALRRVAGPARDRLYVAQQKAAHQNALALHRGYADAGTAAPLRRAAAHIAPVVRTHLNELQSM